MALFKPAHIFRGLRPHEAALARDVFWNTLPPLNTIGVTDGLGQDGTIWTLDRWSLEALQSGPPKSLDQLAYLLNFGEAVRWDLSIKRSLNSAVQGYPDLAPNVFVHEMTHVWQFHRGDSVKSRSLYARSWIGAGYDFTKGDPWETYNVEQQAHIVETWNKERGEGDGKDHELFPYIHYIIRKQGDHKLVRKPAGKGWHDFDPLWTMSLSELAFLLAQETVLQTREETTRVTAKDDSLIILGEDVLFDLNKSNLKPEANAVLERAAATIRSRSGPRLRSITIIGHTDSAGDAAYNQRLSELRAKAVADWFFSRGHLSRSNTIVQGFGKTRPVAPNTDAASRAKNRRVEISLWNN